MKRLVDRFADTVPTTQATVAMEILRADKDKGAITTPQEYKDALTNYLNGVSRQNPKPFITIFNPVVNELSNSDEFNYILKTVEADLRTIFVETDSILQINRAHAEIYREKVLKDLDGALNSLEQEIATLGAPHEQVNRSLSNGPFTKFSGSVFSDESAARPYVKENKTALLGSIPNLMDEKQLES